MILTAPDPALDDAFAAALLTLQRAAYALEAELVGDDRLPPLHEDGPGLAAWRGRWCTAWDGVDLVGAIAWDHHDGHVDIAKVMVRPDALRRGIATALLDHVRREAGARDIFVTTGRDNHPAVSLWARHGFRAEQDDQVPPGIWTTRFRLRQD